jgi:UDP-glucose 4-epimerase
MVAAVAAGVSRFVFVSSGGATYGEVSLFPTPETTPRVPESPYGVAKKVVDEYLRYFRDAHGLDYMSIGPANVYGPRQDPHGEAGVVAIFTRALLGGRRPVIFGDGSQRRDYVYVEDVTDALVRAAEVGGGRFLNVGTGRDTSVLEIFEHLRALTGRRIEPQFAAAKPGDVPRSCLDPTAARQHLGWEPWTPLAEGLARTVEWFRTRPDA